MTSIDIKDRKILYELDLDCRQSNTQIGKKVGLKKDVVSYRIKRMQDEGIIRGFWTAINTFNLGYSVFRIYIALQNASADKKNEIIQYFMDYKNTWAMISSKGEIDLSVILWVNDNNEFYQFWGKTLDLFEEFFAKKIISLYIKTIDYKKTYLLSEQTKSDDREHYRIVSTTKKVEIDKLDYQLLNELATNARCPFIDFATKFHCSSPSIAYRIHSLIKKDIIKAFRVNIDYPKIGLQHHKVDIYLKEHKKRDAIVDFMKTKSYLQCLNVAIGWADIEPEFVIKDISEIDEIINEINSKFPNSVRKHSFWIAEKVHRERWLPELFF
jgi:Lrp/AsnC family transcriptional regulator for asnA, asnC and gidA